MSDLYAVMGHPIGHSRSPTIHRLFAEQVGHTIEYLAIDVAPGSFDAAVADFRSQGGLGLNVTVPYKQEAWALSQERTERAERAGAVNTLSLQGGRVAGDTTDGCGLVTDLTGQHAIALSGMRILLLGAGGAASGVVEPLLAGQPALLHIANRTPGRAAELVERFSVLGPVTGGGYESVDGRFDLLINATSASLGQALPPLKSDWITPETLCYDMMYGIEPTPFMRWASENGAKRAVDGLGMLVGQAAESFAIWRGVRPDVGPVVSALRSIMIDG